MANAKCSLPVRSGTQIARQFLSLTGPLSGRVSLDAPSSAGALCTHFCLLMPNHASTTPYTWTTSPVAMRQSLNHYPDLASLKTLQCSLQGGDLHLVWSYLLKEPCFPRAGTGPRQCPIWNSHGTCSRPSNWACHRNAQRRCPPGSPLMEQGGSKDGVPFSHPCSHLDWVLLEGIVSKGARNTLHAQ